LITLVAAIMLGAWLNRSVLDVSVLHDRNPVYVQLSDGSLRNGYTVKILNKLHAMRSFRLSTEGLEGAELSIVGFNGGEAKIDVVPDNLRALRVLVTLPEMRAKAEARRCRSLVVTDPPTARSSITTPRSGPARLAPARCVRPCQTHPERPHVLLVPRVLRRCSLSMDSRSPGGSAFADEPRRTLQGVAYNRRSRGADNSEGWQDGDRILEGCSGSAFTCRTAWGRPCRLDAVATVSDPLPSLRSPCSQRGRGRTYEATLPAAHEGAWIVDISAFDTSVGSAPPAYQARRRLWIAR
jgi:hypothetical protein